MFDEPSFIHEDLVALLTPPRLFLTYLVIQMTLQPIGVTEKLLAEEALMRLILVTLDVRLVARETGVRLLAMWASELLLRLLLLYLLLLLHLFVLLLLHLFLLLMLPPPPPIAGFPLASIHGSMFMPTDVHVLADALPHLAYLHLLQQGPAVVLDVLLVDVVHVIRIKNLVAHQTHQACMLVREVIAERLITEGGDVDV